MKVRNGSMCTFTGSYLVLLKKCWWGQPRLAALRTALS